MLGSIEAGGTKFVCAVSNSDLNIIDKISIKTRAPLETLTEVFAFFDQFDLSAIGIGCFGPIDINPNSATYGFITSTPKLAWQNFNFLQAIKARYNLPLAWNTDVNVAAYAEYKLGAAQNTNSCIYMTVGTGIGGGIVINGQLIESNRHPEMGHIFIQQKSDDKFTGICPYHSNCLEGLASGPAIEKRWNSKPVDIPSAHQAWQLEAYYLAQAVVNYTLTLAPDMIILGGGIMQKEFMLPMVRSAFLQLLNHYLEFEQLDNYIVLPKLANDAGIMGGLLLAHDRVNG